MALNSIISGDLNVALVNQALNMPTHYKFITSYHQQLYNMQHLYSFYQDKFKTPAIGSDTATLQINSMVLDSTVLNAPITSRTLNAQGNLVITIGTNQGNDFRHNQQILNKNGQKGGINIATTSNTVTLAPRSINGELVTLSVTDWPVGSSILEANQLVADRMSGQQEAQEISPRTILDNLRTYRYDLPLARVDFSSSYVDWANPQSATSAMCALQIGNITTNMMYQKETGIIFDRLGTQLINNRTSNTQMGFIQAVEERGGEPRTSSAKQTWQGHLDMVKTIFSNYTSTYQEVICLAGIDYKWSVITGAEAQNYKFTAGKDSVLEGSGIDFTSVATPAGRITFVDLDIFNDGKVFNSIAPGGDSTYLQNSALFMSVTAMKNNLGGIISPVQEYYGSYGGNTNRISSYYRNGLIDQTGKWVTNVNSLLDGVVVGQISHSAYVIPNAQFAGYYMYNPS